MRDSPSPTSSRKRRPPRRARPRSTRSSSVAPEPRDERDDDDRGDEERGDLDAVRPLDDVDDRRVDEDQRRSRRTPTAAPRVPAPPGGERDGDGRRGHQDQHAGGVGAALGVDVGPEDERDGEGDRR